METKNAKVTILTVAYNAEATIARTIESVLAQTYDRVEYLVIDGLSADQTAAIARSYAPRFAARGYEYRVISEKDAGMYDALNKGARLATGDIVGQINSDDWYEPNAAACAAAYFAATGCDVFWADLRVHKGGKTFVKKAKLSRFMTSRYWNHPTTFFNAAVLKANPYALLSMHDDWELILRLHKQGKKMTVAHEVLANFTLGGMSTQKSLRATCRRIRWRTANYLRNGYSPLYALDCAAMELGKYLLT